MADNADICDVQNAAAFAAALLVRKPEGPKATGRCLSCEKKLAEGLRWCDAACRDDWQREQNGGCRA